MEVTLISGIRHDTLNAIDKGEKLLREFKDKPGQEADALHDATERLVEHLKKELERWERKYKKAEARHHQ
jgi:ElaB/YqjD/DUF883 family membrane-anchored ribosome-binding protein